VVSIGEVLEHVADWPAATTEACRVLRPGGRLILDTINATRVARWLVITLAERIPGGAPPGIHDSALFVNPLALQAECARHGVALEVRGLRPALITLVRWMLTKRGDVPMVPTWSTAVLYQGWGCKSG
jgi:2-polyprenyl-6-hydroxyphenyl methylase/3-demethylubiquinone-9 3-methyltransferase